MSPRQHVSIHAPRAGCDFCHFFVVTLLLSFNSRTPCGVRHPSATRPSGDTCFNSRTPCGVRRLSTRACLVLYARFNSRTPCGVRHNLTLCKNHYSRFQFTHPVRGATSVSGDWTARARRFNSRTPCGVQHKALDVAKRMGVVSIHAPRAGCDTMYAPPPR